MFDVDAAIKDSMRAKDAVALSGYRSVKAKVNLKLTEAGRKADKPLDEAEMTAILKREVKERLEANEYLKPETETYQENARIIQLLEQHLPKQLSEADTLAFIEKVLAETKPTGAKDMGRVMAALRQGGQALDMNYVSAKVKELLAAMG